MPYTRVWDVGLPTGDEPASTIDDIIRALKVDIAERFNTLMGIPEGTALTDPLFTPYYAAGSPNVGAKVIDWANGSVQHVLMTENCVFTFVNPVPGRAYVLIMEQDATAGWVSTLTGYNFGDGGFVPNLAAGMKNVITAMWDGAEYIAGTFATGV